jgi:hypothetical protein
LALLADPGSPRNGRFSQITLKLAFISLSGPFGPTESNHVYDTEIITGQESMIVVSRQFDLGC